MKPVVLLLTLSLILAACSSSPQTASTPAVTSAPVTALDQPDPSPVLPTAEPSPTTPPAVETEAPVAAGQDLVRSDEQGAVAVEVRPVNLETPGETLEFEVGLNTHSVDLSMDLASLASLSTDNGKTVKASLWDAPLGGHHVSGKLVFPAEVDGGPLLEGAARLTLTIEQLDIPERVFTWELN